MTVAQRPEPTDFEKARNRRNIALGLALFAFVVLVFVITIVRFYRTSHGL
jgi:hypothetical protein